MKDYRLREHRREYFDALYRMNLNYGVMPGLVYLYLPELAKRNNWDAEQRLWFAFLNGMTQNPITSLRLYAHLPVCPPAGAPLTRFTEWFDRAWATLQFDTDRRYQKKDTVEAIKAYALAVDHFGSQADMLSTRTAYRDLWARVRGMYKSFGRLSAFSYLEYVTIAGFGSDCDSLMFDDKSGSKSHRNGMFFLLGRDELVWDKRQPDSHSGTYDDFGRMCRWLECEAEQHLAEFHAQNPITPRVGKFTYESNLCAFKNGFFGRRYPGVYADMAWERIEWADKFGFTQFTQPFKEIREDCLPNWLRIECDPRGAPGVPARKALFKDTGRPFRGAYFLEE